MNKRLKIAIIAILMIIGTILIYRALFIKTVTGLKNDKIGMDSDGVTAARFRWTLFEEWVNSRPQYKGWESNSEIFKKANDEFKDKIPSSVKVLK